uniref:Uncharacterized protein n=1 Tax=Setaria viridis TaxID=4556 RepID=A0A4U6UK35_SETVI|nr:hypothetical protein SEVIR_5G177565v2 [Setaria viridis]
MLIVWLLAPLGLPSFLRAGQSSGIPPRTKRAGSLMS